MKRTFKLLSSRARRAWRSPWDCFVPLDRLGVLAMTVVLLLVFLWWHFRLGQTRYFDVDEFAHLSWSYQMLSGRRPYVDFLFFFPPGFHVFLMPLFALGGGVAPILAGRVAQFVLFVLLVGATMLLFWLMRRSWLAVLAGVLLAFLPMPFDKFLEIRPDTLATLLVMLGMIFQILASQDTLLRARKRVSYVFAGFFYGLSLLVLPKVLPQVAVAAAVVLMSKKRPTLLPFFLGLAAPLVLFGLWALTLGDVGKVIYSLIKLPLEANKISQTFIMMPDLFFYPNATFYGSAGWSGGLLVNHAIWLIAIFVAAYRLVVPRGWPEFLVAATFFTSVFFYVQIVPLKHTQYLVPVAVFVAFYAADAVDMLWEAAGRKIITVIIIITVIEIGLYRVFLLVNSPKLAWTNADTMGQLAAIYETIPTAEYIFDLTGQTLYYRHPYIACCIPFGQAVPYLTRPLPSLTEALEKTKTKYIFEGGVKRVSTLLPEDRAYIDVHYLPHPAIAGLLVRK